MLMDPDIHAVHIHNKASARVQTTIANSSKHTSMPTLSEKENILPGTCFIICIHVQSHYNTLQVHILNSLRAITI